MLFSNSISSITNNPLISETTPNVGQFGWTQADIGNYNQLLIYVDQCRQYAEFCAEKAEYISYTVSNVVLPALDEMNQIQDQVTGISEDINNIYNSILVINGDITVKYDDFLIKYSDFITKYSDFLPKYDEVLVAHGEVLTYRNEAQAFAESSETSAANSQHYYDLTYSIYLELQDGRVYRGTWNPHTLAYPNPLGTNSLWDVILNEGEATFDFDGKTWKWGEKLLYLTSDGLYQQIQSGSSVYSVNGEIGFVTITLDDLGGFAKTGGTITGKTTFTNSTTGINIEGGTGTSGTSGDLRFNTSLLEFEGYASGEWKPVGGGGSVTWSSVNTNTTAQVGKGYLVNASGLTITLPASPAPGKTVGIGDYNSQNFSVTVARNGKPIMGVLEDLVFNTKNSNVVLAYVDNTVGWILTQGFGESQAPYAVFNKIRKTDVAGQTEFPFASPATNAVDVYYNGTKLDPVTDYAVTTSTVTLTTPVLASDDVIEIYGWNQALILNAEGIAYDNTESGLTAGSMQGAIDDICSALSEQSGVLAPTASWSDVPAFSDLVLGGPLNAQAEALSARTEQLKLDIQDVKAFATVAEMKSSNRLKVGDAVRTKGYYVLGDGGAGEYLVRAAGFPIALDAAGLIHPVLPNGNVLELQFSEHLDFLQAGGKADWNATTLTGSNNSPILQNAIDYLFPFVWQGSVSATNNKLHSFRCPIFVPGNRGKYMLADPIKLNPHTAIIGPEVQRGFMMEIFGSSAVGAFFVPNLTDKSKYILDSAPYGTDGVRNTDPMKAFTNAEMDSSLFTRCPAVKIKNIFMCPDANTNAGDTSIHFSPLRLVGGEGAAVLDNYFGQTLHGPSIQASWDYKYDGNLAQTFDCALSIYQGTTGKMGINYCSKIGQLRLYSATLPDWWPTADGGAFINGDVNTPASLVIKDVTGGKVDCGDWINEAYGRAVLADNSAFEFDLLHSETIETTLIAARGCIFSAKSGYTFLPSNRLFKPVLRISGCKVTFSDFTFGCCGSMASYIDAGSEVNLLQGCRAQNAANGTVHQGLIQSTPYTERVNGKPSIYYADLDTKPVRDLYVNVSGAGLRNDTYYGYDDNSAMLTLQAALGRVKQNSSVNILLRNNSAAPTSETFTATPAVTGAKVSLSLRFTNRPFAVTGTTYLADAKFDFGTGLRWAGTTAFELERSVEINMGGDSIMNYSGQVFKVATGKAAALTLLKTDTAAFNTTGAFSDAASVMSVLFMNASSNLTAPAGGWGAKTKVL